MSTDISNIPVQPVSNLRFYNHVLTGDLREHVQKQLALLPSEQLSLFEEIAIHRIKCADAIEKWDKAKKVREYCEYRLQSLRTIPDTSIQEIKTAEEDCRLAIAGCNLASDQMAEALKFQKELVSSAAVNDSKTKETIATNTMMLLITGVLNLVHEYFNRGDKESVELLDQFEEDLRKRVLIQEVDNQALAVETEYYQMLSSIPEPDTVDAVSED
jgi:hypothetical protein